MAERIDTLILGSHVVTMNATRDIIRDGAVALRGSRIVGVGRAGDLKERYEASETVGGDRSWSPRGWSTHTFTLPVSP